MDTFSAPHFRDDEAARKALESILWPDGPVCPHCGVFNHAYATKRPGVFRCAEKDCRKDFTVTMRGKSGPANKRPIVALVERGGSVRTFHVPVCDQASVEKIVTENIARESRLHTDESRLYFNASDLFATHETVKHSAGEYVRG